MSGFELDEKMVNHFAKFLTDKSDDAKKDDKDAFKKRKVTIAREGTKIILPGEPRDMTEDEAILALQAVKEEKTKMVAIREEFDCYPLEGAWALRKVLERMYGYVMTGAERQSLFGKMPAAALLTLEVGPGQKEQVLWGKFNIPGLQGEITTGAAMNRGIATFLVQGTVTLGDRETVEKIAWEVREFLKTNSLYKGKSIKIQTVEDFDSGSGRYVVDFQNPPTFLDLSKVNENELVFSDDVNSLIQTNLFTPIEKTELCRKAGVPLKRTVLLEGPYGTGKTLTAFVTAKKCEANGWTFIYMDRAQALKDVLIFARKYAPVAIFCEDVEQVTSGGRTVQVNDVFNNIDGIDSKGHEVLCIFTTNHIEKIEPGMLRGGRIDAVVSVLPPDAKAAGKLIKVYARDLMAPDADVSVASKELDGLIPAFIREVVERAKLFALTHLKTGEKLQLTGDDVRMAAVGMKAHFKLVNRGKPKALTAGDRLALALVDLLGTEGVLTGSSDYESEESAIQHRMEIDRQDAVTQ